MDSPRAMDKEDVPGAPVPDYSPEARRRAARNRRGDSAPRRRGPDRARVMEVGRRVAVGTWNDGFIHAGNLAYMSMLAIFPFFILGAAVFSAVGEAGERVATVNAVQAALPPTVGDVIGPAARDAIASRSGWLLWAGSAVALWTVSSLIETVRDILRRAYGTEHTLGFWRHRLISAGIIVAAMVLLLFGLVAQVMIGTVEEAIDAWAPQLIHSLDGLALSRIVPTLVVYGSVYLLFLSLTPTAYRSRRYPKWPGALTVTLWWFCVTVAFPPLLRSMFTYSLTYGSLAGIMIALFFFWLVGLGVVVGAELNAALASTPEEEGAGTQDETDKEETAR